MSFELEGGYSRIWLSADSTMIRKVNILIAKKGILYWLCGA